MCKKFTRFILIICAVLVSSSAMFSQNFWERTNGPNGHTYTIAVASNGDIWAGGMGTVYLSTNNGDTWVRKGSFPSTYVINQIAVNPMNGYIFVNSIPMNITSSANEVFRSTDNGNTWVKVIDEMYVYDIFITPSGEIYLGDRSGCYYSADNGDTWIEKNNWSPSNNQAVYSFALGKDGTIYAGTSNGVYRSTNGGDTWLPPSNHTNVYPNVNAYRLTISEDGSIFAAIISSDSRGVLKSTDRGVSWAQINNGLAFMYINNDSITYNSIRNIIYNPITRDIISSEESYNSIVYRSTNLGESWELANTGIANSTYPLKFALNPNTGQMYIANNNPYPNNNGVYRSTKQAISVKEPVEVVGGDDILLFQSSPNPVRSGYETAIYYKINNAGQTSLIVYDILGREVTKLVNEYKSAGAYSVNFNTGGLASGVYFYKLITTGYEEFKKMLIIR